MQQATPLSKNKTLDGLLNHLIRVDAGFSRPDSSLKLEKMIVEVFRASSRFTLKDVPSDEQTAWIVAAAILADPANIGYRNRDIEEFQIARHVVYELHQTYKPGHAERAFFGFYKKCWEVTGASLVMPLFDIVLDSWALLSDKKDKQVRAISESDLVNISIDRLEGDKEKTPVETLYYKALDKGCFDSSDIPSAERKKLTCYFNQRMAAAARAAKEYEEIQKKLQEAKKELSETKSNIGVNNVILKRKHNEQANLNADLKNAKEELENVRKEAAREKKAAEAAIRCRVQTEQETAKVMDDKINWQMYVDRISRQESEKLAYEEAEYRYPDVYFQEPSRKDKWDERERKFQNWLEESIKHDQETLEWFDSI